jgi:hypothetical protein
MEHLGLCCVSYAGASEELEGCDNLGVGTIYTTYIQPPLQRVQEEPAWAGAR